MARFALVYGLRVAPVAELKSTRSAAVILKDGVELDVTMHVIEGDRDQIRAQLQRSLDAFFDVFEEMAE